MLEIFHGPERGVVGVRVRTADTVLHHAAMIVVLLSVDESIVDAQVGEAADEDQRLGLSVRAAGSSGRSR